jgi:CDGSH-type Zn-finger protein
VAKEHRIVAQPIPCNEEDTMPELTMRALENGPWMLPGPAKCVMAEAHETITGETVYLCRCGASARKPFCDGTHRKSGFEAPPAELTLLK